MKKILFLLILSSTYILAPAQNPPEDFWKIKWNKKIILETSRSNEVTNTRTIKAADLKKNYTLEISYKSYKEADAYKDKDWFRSFMILDESDAVLLRKDSTRNVKITGAELKKMVGDKKKLKIYTMAIPSDPELAARVRVRRVHLCTLQLQ